MATSRELLVVGGILCVPAALGVAFFLYGWADADALKAAPICQAPSRNSSTCESVFPGMILARYPGGSKSLPSVNVNAGGTTTKVGCACDEVSFAAGQAVSTGWWKGQLVALGPPSETPAVETDASPENHLGIEAWLLVLVIPAVSFLIEGLLHRKASTTLKQLFEDSLASKPEPPRRIDRRLVQRVAWTNYVLGLPASWALVLLLPYLPVTFGLINPRLAPLAVLGALLVAIALMVWVTDSYYGDLLRTAARRTLDVRRVELVPTRGGKQTVVTYDLLNGKTETFGLNQKWNGHVRVGDRLDAMTNAKSGSIRYLLSTPPAQA